MTFKSTKPLKTQIGSDFEQLAYHYLISKGLSLIAKNWQVAKVGEIDLIMLDNTLAMPTLVFVEVRYRKNKDFGGADASITLKKQQKIIQTAQYFLAKNDNYIHHDCRFDTICIHPSNISKAPQIPDINWIQAAFIL